MTTVVLVLALLVLALGAGLVVVVLLELVRQNGRLLLRVEALEETLSRIAQIVAEHEVNAFLLAYPWLRMRDETNDVAILREIVCENCYRLPPAFEREDVIVDIGAHVGIFALAVLARGCGEVHCFEPSPANAAAARRHLAPLGGRARLTQSAVWRSDATVASLHFQPHSDPENLGGGAVYHETGTEVSALSLDDILRDVSRAGQRRIRLLKLDCEGSEYPILLTAKCLDLVDEIVGEYHVVPDEITAKWDLGREFSIQLLASCLNTAGFEVVSNPDDSESNALGVFFTRRRTAPTLS